MFVPMKVSTRLLLGFLVVVVLGAVVAGIGICNLDRMAARARTVMLVLAVGNALAGIVLALLVTRSLARQLGGEPAYAAGVASRIAAGDLATPVAVRSGAEGSLLWAMETMRAQLATTVRAVRRGTGTIAAASSRIAGGNLDLSARTEEQASSLEETASSMEQLTSTVKQNADNARQANALAQTASDVATRGGAVVAQVVQTMGSISASSKKIVDIITVIDGIAFQTNILALNAAVEAARAGEQGRGFAVVAGEVRTLAQRSASAAKEIKQLIDTSVSNVETGTTLVDQAGKTMHDVVASIQRVTDIMAEISAASQEQTAGIEQINQAIIQMDTVTQQNAGLVEQAAATSDALQAQATQLEALVSVFCIDADPVPAQHMMAAAAQDVHATLPAPAPAALAQQNSMSQLAAHRTRAETACRPVAGSSLDSAARSTARPAARSTPPRAAAPIVKTAAQRAPASAEGAPRHAAPAPSAKWAAKLAAPLRDHAAATPRPGRFGRFGNDASAQPPVDEWEEF